MFQGRFRRPCGALFLVSALAAASPLRAESVFTLDEVINLRSFFGEGGVLIDEEEPRFEWAGPVASDAAKGLLYVAGPEGVGVIDEANRRPIAWLERTEFGGAGVVSLRGLAAMDVQPSTGDLYVYQCAPCRDENIGAQFAAVTPLLPIAKSVRRFQPLRTPEGSPIIIDQLAFDAEGNVLLFKGATFTPADAITGDFGELVRVGTGVEAHAGGGAAFDPVTGHLFTVRYDNQLAEVDPVTLDVISVTDLDEFISFPSRRPFTRAARGLAFSPTGDKLYITADNHALDGPSNGRLVVVNRTVVPEPATLLMLASAALGMLTCLTRRRF